MDFLFTLIFVVLLTSVVSTPTLKLKFPPCIPIPGKTGVLIGQDFKSIHDYVESIQYIQPFGTMVYTALYDETNGALAGLMKAIDYGSGIQWTTGLEISYPQTTINLGLWLVDQCNMIIAGQLDSTIDLMISAIKYSNHGYYLRVGYEFDWAENHYEPNEYVGAFRHIVLRFKHANITNVRFVWHASTALPLLNSNLSYADYFPGIDVVDLCAVSIFEQPYQKDLHLASSLAKYCQKMDIPIMIAESTPFGGLIDPIDNSSVPLNSTISLVNRAGYNGVSWEVWFKPVLQFIKTYDIRIWSYINCNWDSLPMYENKHATGIYWGDSRVQEFNHTFSMWKTNILSSPNFLNTIPSNLYYDQDVYEQYCLMKGIPVELKNSTQEKESLVSTPIPSSKPTKRPRSSHHHTPNRQKLSLFEESGEFVLQWIELFIFSFFLISCIVLIALCIYRIHQRWSHTLPNQTLPYVYTPIE